MDGINLGKHDRREPHMLVIAMGVFKGEYVNRIHILPFLNVTSSKIRIHMWLERLVALLNK